MLLRPTPSRVAPELLPEPPPRPRRVVVRRQEGHLFKKFRALPPVQRREHQPRTPVFLRQHLAAFPVHDREEAVVTVPPLHRGVVSVRGALVDPAPTRSRCEGGIVFALVIFRQRVDDGGERHAAEAQTERGPAGDAVPIARRHAHPVPARDGLDLPEGQVPRTGAVGTEPCEREAMVVARAPGVVGCPRGPVAEVEHHPLLDDVVPRRGTVSCAARRRRARAVPTLGELHQPTLLRNLGADVRVGEIDGRAVR